MKRIRKFDAGHRWQLIWVQMYTCHFIGMHTEVLPTLSFERILYKLRYETFKVFQFVLNL